MKISLPRWRDYPFPEIRFTAALGLLLLAVFTSLRLILLWRNANLATALPAALVAESFLVGLRFDLAVSSYLLIPFFLLLLVLRGRMRKWLLFGMIPLVGMLILAGLAEAEFYRELAMRLNSLIFEYLGHPLIVAGMIWEGYPIFSFLLLGAALLGLFSLAYVRLQRRLLQPPAPEQKQAAAGIPLRAVAALVTLALLVLAARGGLAHEPLRWGDAYFCEEPFPNDLALNGIFTLGRSVIESLSGKDRIWVKSMSAAEANRATREMLLVPGETDLSSSDHPILRSGTGLSAPSPWLRQDFARPLNVVVILLESFSARHVGALGAPPGITPDFDALSAKGILFERAFSNGTHTHQGVFASLASFPNLPGFEYLMKTTEARQEFSGLPTLLKRQGYQSIFLYNGLFSWDNKEGFFRQHGMDRFVGRDDYVNPTFVDPVWGVSDYDVFMRAATEFKALAAKGPFFGAVLTLSNHPPFNLPAPLPFPRIVTGDAMEGRWNAMRYSDWALGEFFRKAEGEDWFWNTLFVITGDHGFGGPHPITGMKLDAHHVPLLFYSPVLKPSVLGRRSTVASQVDIGASVVGLLGLETPHQSWGRNLFGAPPSDQGFAVVKASAGKDSVALIQGDYVLIRDPKGAPQFYRCGYGFPPQVERLSGKEETDRRAAMEHRLKAYVESGLLALRGRHLGLSAGDLSPLAHTRPGDRSAER